MVTYVYTLLMLLLTVVQHVEPKRATNCRHDALMLNVHVLLDVINTVTSVAGVQIRHVHVH